MQNLTTTVIDGVTYRHYVTPSGWIAQYHLLEPEIVDFHGRPYVAKRGIYPDTCPNHIVNLYQVVTSFDATNPYGII